MYPPALGSKSGFDAIADCYADLAEHITAVETGLSSDPEMNWRVSSLDRYRLVSNSDAHSLPALAREVNRVDPDVPIAETITLPLRLAAYEELRYQYSVVEIDDLPRGADSRFHPHAPLSFQRGARED